MSLTKVSYSMITGAVANVLDFGAVGNSSVNLSPALQAAHDSLGPDGGAIYIPAASSNYLMTYGVVFTKPIKLFGDGWYSSEILTRTSAVTLISTNSKLDVEGLHFTALDAARGTCTFLFHQSDSANHGHSTFFNNYFDGARFCYLSHSTNAVVIDNNVIGAQGANGVGLLLENFVNSDTGDSFITNNTISGASTALGIQVNSTSGINICNNKFNDELAHVFITVGANLTGNFLFSNNSFEGHTDYAIKLIATTGTITKSLITGNQFSATTSNHVVLSQGAVNTTITGNTFNHTNASLGNGIAIESGAQNITITGNAFHQILSAITCAAGTSAGITASGNRFASDVTVAFVGDDGVNTLAGNKQLALSQYVQNASDTVYVDAFKFKGYGTLEIKVYGIVQGVGACNYQRTVLMSDTTTSDIDAAVSIGAAFDLLISAASGYSVVSIKRSTGIGTMFTGYCEVIASGQITDARFI